MRLDRSELSKAVTTALSLGAVAAVGVAGTAFAQDAAQAQSNQKQPQTLQTIVVTGSHIRRVDLQTSNPVHVVTNQEIQASGKVTLGDLIQDLPSNAGAATNPQVNNGGGTGSSGVSLRGLGSGRTLVLIDGHRYSNTDLNIIPVDMIERVEVLKDGASSVYGSDAIGGVVNIILKNNYQGAEFSANYGISDRSDGARRAATFFFGQTSDKGSIMGGVSYNKQDGISSAARKFSDQALYLYSGFITALGSSRNPNGRVFLPDSLQAQYGGCGTVTKQSGDGTALADYRCYHGATDSFNYQQKNWDLTPQERTNAFVKGTYQLTDNVQAFAEFFTNNTHSQSAVAPIPFDAAVDGVVISKDSMYNPFGVDFGGSAGNEYLNRFTGVGQRISSYSTATMQGTLGLRGNIGTWDWTAYYNYGHVDLQTHDIGYPLYNTAFRAALGPSMLVGGVPTCVTTPGDATTAIAGCTPINIFDANSPAVTAQLQPFFSTLFGSDLSTRRAYYAEANGPLFELPGGQAQLAVGVDYQKEYAHNLVDSQRVITDLVLGTCGAPQSACATQLQGGFTTKEAYAELFLPILKDLPFARSLNVTLGERYTKNSVPGSTTSSSNYKIALEWHPIDDLLVRGTVTKVFRSPTIGNLFAGALGSAPALVDPCVGLSAGELAAHSNACAGVPAGWAGTGLSQTTAVREGSVAAGLALKPEFGKTFDYGMVYDPHFIPGLSVNVDLWRVLLDDTLSSPGAQTIMNVCFQDNSNPLCSLISRPNATSHATLFSLPTINLGKLDFKGVDFGFQYQIPEISWLPGKWNVNFESTYIARADFNTVPGSIPATHMAGKYSSDFGAFPRVRALGSLAWNMGPWDASWSVRYIGKEQIGSLDPSQNLTADLVLPQFVLKVPSITYNDLQVGYNIQPINTKIDLGVNNAFDKQPPILTQTNVTNANTDVSTYDVVGRFYWARATVKF